MKISAKSTSDARPPAAPRDSSPGSVGGCSSPDTRRMSDSTKNHPNQVMEPENALVNARAYSCVRRAGAMYQTTFKKNITGMSPRTILL